MAATYRPVLPQNTSWSVRALAGEPSAVIRVRNLQAVVSAGVDAWGRKDKAQPVLVSVEVHLRQPFVTSASSDAVGTDTVHYGLLSKAILQALDDHTPNRRKADLEANDGTPASRRAWSLLDDLWTRLTGWHLCGPKVEQDTTPFLNVSSTNYLSLTVMFPKASLLGEGVSFSAAAMFRREGDNPFDCSAVSMRLHRLRVPTLVGVNSNERLAKQVVVADVEIDKAVFAADVYPELEAVVTQAIATSSFGTLEALGSHIVAEIQKFGMDKKQQWEEACIKVALEKPTAVPLAEGACVEIAVSGKMADRSQFQQA